MQKLAATPEGRAPDRRALAVVEESPTLAASLRTTCVATLLRGGTRVNALPASAVANVNCRLLPDETPEQARRELERILGDPSLQVKDAEHGQAFGRPDGGSSPVDGPGPAAVRKVIGQMWPGVPVVPFISRGGTDSRRLRAAGIAAYGLVPIGNTEADSRRAHGVDERIPAAGLRSGVELLHRLVLELAGEPRRP
jgi:acetylornithine deacetylase/succinyl-diaminopimelate desuccinylase-like protein